jgi:hypothetical protein
MWVEMGGRRDAMVANGDESGQVGLSGSVLGTESSVGILYCEGEEGMVNSVGSGGDLGFWPSLLASFCRRKTSPARLTSVRPQITAMRQSSGAWGHPRPLVRMGRFSPVSKTSSAESQYGVGMTGSPSSASDGSCSIRFPKKKSVVPRMV